MRRICKRADNAIAGRAEVAKDHVTALFAADIQIALHHFLDHVTIAHFRAQHFAAGGIERFVEAKVAHHGCDQSFFPQTSRA